MATSLKCSDVTWLHQWCKNLILIFYYTYKLWLKYHSLWSIGTQAFILQLAKIHFLSDWINLANTDNQNILTFRFPIATIFEHFMLYFSDTGLRIFCPYRLYDIAYMIKANFNIRSKLIYSDSDELISFTKICYLLK